MPVTAKLSRKFYDQFGDDIVNELVEWFNKVDETYRTGLRELNELNFARFDAKLEQRIAELRAELRHEIGELGSGIRQEMATLGSGIRQEIARDRVTQMRWMVGLWAAQAALLLGTVLTVLQSR